ncbi:GNAT family N-acetyltransferase [Anaeromicropila herbilytica]|uniref:N-acetyltransferase n=1 Tax=Anaeromicropila herbilytica TaxID=2785025 RepID=A0A7R7IE80_9FIRM|nr:GNAT family N-acetyltransferase [Anaeromicropila herbilytica]BCN30818.1 N-acetyltransferase [Anaeromicropila herbilytica]
MVTQIRKANRKDSSRLAEILIFAKRTAYRPIFKNDNVSFNEMQVLDLALEFRDKESVLDNIYVYDDGIVKGLIRFYKCDNECNENRMEIAELYVDTFFQGQGIGSILIKNCIEQAKKHNIRTIFLWVLEKNDTARKFYEKHGFVPEGTSKIEDGTTEMITRYKLEM